MLRTSRSSDSAYRCLSTRDGHTAIERIFTFGPKAANRSTDGRLLAWIRLGQPWPRVPVEEFENEVIPPKPSAV
jgi:hypothetical protein